MTTIMPCPDCGGPQREVFCEGGIYRAECEWCGKNHRIGRGTLPADLEVGDRLPSPRADEGTVTIVCAYGRCTHDPSRHDSVHVRGGPYRNEWFIALIPNVPLHVCASDTCWLDFDGDHGRVNSHAQ